MTIEAITYNKHKNLKLAAAELGLCWQTLYSRLKNQGVPVTGDKLRYGTDRDRLGALAEAKFQELVPFANDKTKANFKASMTLMYLATRLMSRAAYQEPSISHTALSHGLSRSRNNR